MNQILSTKENNYNKKNGKNHSDLLDMKKIVIIFSILIIAFAIIIISAKVYGIIKEKDSKNPISALNKPMINIEKIENQCKIEIEYDEGLDKISYWWDDENIIEKNMNGSTTPFVTTIQIPEEKNTIYVKATGIDGSLSEMEKNFTSGESVEKPEIQWLYQAGKLNITARSNKGMKSLSYQWEGEELKTITSTEENQEIITTTIDAKRGANKISITATDIEGNKESRNVTIQGVFEPEMSLIIENNRTLKVSIKHDMGFKKVIITVNGEEKIYDENTPQYSKDIQLLTLNVEVPPGRLNVEMRVYTLEQPDKEYYKNGWADIQ